MLIEVCFLGEFLTAHKTLVLASFMGFVVSSEAALVREKFATFLAHMFLYSGVKGKNVLSEIVLLCKLFPTFLTLIVFDASMSQCVLDEMGALREAFAALPALVVLLPGVSAVVEGEATSTQEPLAADLALVVLHAGVSLRMLGESTFENELFTTLPTLKVLDAIVNEFVSFKIPFLCELFDAVWTSKYFSSSSHLVHIDSLNDQVNKSRRTRVISL